MRDYLNSITFKRWCRISLVLTISLTIFWLSFENKTGNVPSYSQIGLAMVIFERTIAEIGIEISQWFTLITLPGYIFFILWFLPKPNNGILKNIFFSAFVIGLLDTFIFGVLTGLASTLGILLFTELMYLTILFAIPATIALLAKLLSWVLVFDNDSYEDEKRDEKIEERHSFPPSHVTHHYGALKNHRIGGNN